MLLQEHTRFVFRGDAAMRSDRPHHDADGARRAGCIFRDNKEGVIGMRVARALEQPADKPEVFTDATGKPTAVPVLDNAGVTGSLHEQRRADRRQGLGHARPLVRARRASWTTRTWCC